MRDVKFRARFRKISNNKECLQVCLLQKGKIINPLDNLFGYVQITDWEQFTGLKDKNSKEIFKGDVLKIETASGTYFAGLVGMNDGCFDVQFLNGHYEYDPVINTTRIRDYLKCFTCNHAAEVIGNKFENPELWDGNR